MLSCGASLKNLNGRNESEGFVRDIPQNLKVEGVKTKLLYAFVRDFPQNLQVEDVKTKLSYAFVRDFTQNLKVLKVEDVKTKVSFETPLKI